MTRLAQNPGSLAICGLFTHGQGMDVSASAEAPMVSPSDSSVMALGALALFVAFRARLLRA